MVLLSKKLLSGDFGKITYCVQKNLKKIHNPFTLDFKWFFTYSLNQVLTNHYSPNGRFLVQETFVKTLPRFVLILISLQRWQHRVRNETKHFVSPHLIGPQFLANQHETNQHKRAALIGLFHATSSVLLSVESYQNYRKPTHRGVQAYLSSLQQRVTNHRSNPRMRVILCFTKRALRANSNKATPQLLINK